MNHRDTEDAEENGRRISATPSPGLFDLGGRTGHEPRWLTVVLVCLLAMSAAVLLYCHPYNASNLRITPDEIEYALGGHRIAEAGRFEILVDGQWLPSRYPPWFSLFVVAPAYLILGMDPGNAIVPVTLFGIAGVIIAFFIGKRISGVWGGLLAGLGVLALPYYRLMGRIVMTDVPSACLALALCLLFIRWRSTQSQVTMGRLVLAGVIVAVATSFRVTNAALIFPFLLFCRHGCPSRTVINMGALSAPLMLLTVLQLGYNEHVFGSPWRNGYHYWAPVPYDYFHLTFQPGYLLVGLGNLLKNPADSISIVLPLGLVAGWWLLRRKRSDTSGGANQARLTILFLMLGTTLIAMFYMFYFFQSVRFLLPVMAVMVAVAGGLAGRRLRSWGPTVVIGLACCALIAALLVRHFRIEEPPFARMTADDINRLTPDDALIISSLPPPYIEYMVGRHSHRQLIPISRNVAYAGDLIAPKKVANPEPPPVDWKDSRCEGLRKGGASDAVSAVAAESMEKIEAEVRRGRAVYITPAYLGDENRPVAESINAEFNLVKVHEGLYKLTLPD